jgi:hypothetical protein
MVDLPTLMQRKAKLEGEIARAKRAEKIAERKADSRRKIILGSVVLAAMREGALSENGIRGLINRFAADRDKPVFENWNFETPATVSAVPETANLVSLEGLRSAHR